MISILQGNKIRSFSKSRSTMGSLATRCVSTNIGRNTIDKMNNPIVMMKFEEVGSEIVSMRMTFFKVKGAIQFPFKIELSNQP